MECVQNNERRTGSVFNNAIQLLQLFKPAMSVMENVVGLKSVSMRTGRSNHKACEDLVQAAGYLMVTLEISPEMFGIPQSRPRLYFLLFSMSFIAGLVQRHNLFGVEQAVETMRAQIVLRMDRFASEVDVLDLKHFLLDEASEPVQSYYKSLPQTWEPRSVRDGEMWTNKLSPGYSPTEQDLSASPGVKALCWRQWDALLAQGQQSTSSKAKAKMAPSNLSQDKDRIQRVPGARSVPCQTPAAQTWLPSVQRLMHPIESLRLQMMLGAEAEAAIMRDLKLGQIQKLSGNALNAHCSGVALLVGFLALSAVAFPKKP